MKNIHTYLHTRWLRILQTELTAEQEETDGVQKHHKQRNKTEGAKSPQNQDLSNKYRLQQRHTQADTGSIDVSGHHGVHY